MKPKFLLTLVLFCLTLTAVAQNRFLLDGSYDSYKICSLPDGEFVALCSTYGPYMYVYRFQEDGDIIWTAELPFSAYPQHHNIKVDPSGNILVLLATELYIVSPDGLILFSHEYTWSEADYDPIPDDLGYYNWQTSQLFDEDLFIVAHGNAGGGNNIRSINKVDFEGNLYASKAFITPINNYATSIQKKGDSLFVLFEDYFDDEPLNLVIFNASTLDIISETSIADEFIYPQLDILSDGYLVSNVNNLDGYYTNKLTKYGFDGGLIYDTEIAEFAGDSVNSYSFNFELESGQLIGLQGTVFGPDDNYGYCVRHFDDAGNMTYQSERFLEGFSYHIWDADLFDNKIMFTGYFYDTLDYNMHGMVGFLDTLGNFTTIQIDGISYHDANGNGVFDIDEYKLPGFMITKEPFGVNYFTGSEGEYDCELVFDGTYTMTPQLPEYWDNVTPASYSYELNPATTGTSYTEQNFAYTYTTEVTELLVSIDLNSLIRPGGTRYLNISVTNLGNQIIPAGEIELHYPGIINYAGGSPYVSHTDTIITYAYPELPPLHNEWYNVVIDCPIDLIVGTPYQFICQSDVIPLDINPTNNIDIIDTVVVNSYDPNMKVADPVGKGINGATDPETEYMEYVIHFQNLGTAPAINIVISDTLDAAIDPLSLQMLAASHNYRVELSGGNIVRWYFDEINLPDSSSNPEGSMGFVSFRTKLLEDLPIGTVITNTAYIYFDYNEAVITNTTLNTLTAEVIGIEQSTAENTIFIYPNPAANEISIMGLRNNSASMVTISDLSGKIVMEQKLNVLSEQPVVMDISSVPNGFYFITLKNIEGEKITSSKLAISK